MPKAPKAKKIDLPAGGVEAVFGKSKRPKPSAPAGNYMGYYTRRNDFSNNFDPRLDLVPHDWIAGKKVLDVGCNIGLVTVQLAQRFSALRVVGVDMDEKLINSCRDTVQCAWSRQKPNVQIRAMEEVLKSAKDSTYLPKPEQEIAGEPVEDCNPIGANYFPMAFPRMFGFVPLPPRDVVTTTDSNKQIVGFPHNISFFTSDWVQKPIQTDHNGYDVIIAFSITKWIHLNTLNTGLRAFFQRCYDCLRPSGRFIVEPQLFSTYLRSAKAAHVKERYFLLRDGDENTEKGWRYEDGDFDRVLQDIGFERGTILGETGRDGFKRPVVVYLKK